MPEEKIKILVINGPNLQLLGKREVDIYGTFTLKNIEHHLEETAASLKNVDVVFFQSNHEGDIVDKIAESLCKQYNGILINPAAYTHTSIAIHDAIKSVNIPAIEVHISNIYNREEYRKHSFIAPACIGQISGLGLKGYGYALSALVDYVRIQQVPS